MSSNKCSHNNRLETVPELNNEFGRLFDSENFDGEQETRTRQNLNGEGSEVAHNNSATNTSESVYRNFDVRDTFERSRPSLASHHRVHHHNHHHHRDGSKKNSEALQASAKIVDEPINRAESSYETLNDTSQGEEEMTPKKRTPLAAHHRAHRYHSSDAHHQSSESHHRSRRSTRRSSSKSIRKVEYYPATGNDFQCHVETMGIDEEEYARLHRENLEEQTKNAQIENDWVGQKLSKKETNAKEQPLQEQSVQVGTVISQENVVITYHSQQNKLPETEKNNWNAYNQRASSTVPRLGATILAAREANPRATRKASSVKSAGSRARQKKANVRTVIIRILIGIVAVLVSCIAILLIMRARGQSSMTPNGDNVEIVMPNKEIPDDAAVEDDGKTVIYKGQKYRWNDNITTFLILGTDRTIEQREIGETAAGINGQADTILLAVIDNTNKKISFINVNRDTFIPVAEYSPDGDYAGIKKMQICLSYAYGKDDETSCRYTAEAVSKYLYGMPVDYYVGLSYDAIQVLNDSVGGVTLTVAEDLTSVDPSLKQGTTVTLAGSQAMTYVRWRNMSIVETNENRISRQKQYLYSFMARTIDCTRQDFLLPFGLFANAKPYMTTNVTASQLTYITSKVLEYGVSGDSIHSIPGQSVEGSENHVEFYPDQTALYEQVLTTFYNKEE